MSKPYEQIYAEVGAACEYVAGGGLLPDLAPDAIIEASRFRKLHHADALPNYYPLELVDLGPSVVAVETQEEYRLVFGALAEQRPGFITDDTVPAVQSAIRHEADHAAIAELAIGFAQTAFSLAVTECGPEEGELAVLPFTQFAGPKRRVSKLAVAAIIGVPYMVTGTPFCPSPGDMACLNAMGYEQRDDIAREIAARQGLFPTFPENFSR